MEAHSLEQKTFKKTQQAICFNIPYHSSYLKGDKTFWVFIVSNFLERVRTLKAMFQTSQGLSASSRPLLFQTFHYSQGKVSLAQLWQMNWFLSIGPKFPSILELSKFKRR